MMACVRALFEDAHKNGHRIRGIDMFVKLALEQGCKSFPEIKALKEQDPERYRHVCGTIRSDGAYLFAGENDYAMVDNLAGHPAALGIFGYSFLYQNRNLIKGSSINGDRPSAQNIANGRYSLVRPLYIYVKKNRLNEVLGLREYVEEFTNEWTIGPDGYLSEVGLIPLPKEDRRKNYYIARELTPLSIDDL